MQTTSFSRWSFAVALAPLLAGIGVLFAQDPAPRIRGPADESSAEREREGGAGRPGGIPRDRARERDAERSEGSEEGVPQVQLDPGFRSGQPRIAPPRGDWKLGVWGYNTETGLVITRVQPGSSAAREGLERGDKIVAVGGYQIGYVGDLLYPLGYELQRQAGSRGQVLLLVQNVRNSELQNLSVRLDRGGSFRPLDRDRDARE